MHRSFLLCVPCMCSCNELILSKNILHFLHMNPSCTPITLSSVSFFFRTPVFRLTLFSLSLLSSVVFFGFPIFFSLLSGPKVIVSPSILHCSTWISDLFSKVHSSTWLFGLIESKASTIIFWVLLYRMSS
uniref:Uncharacterized protein n=1 Tax=Cacopsylla melanoneura TaxID=428564 RepID=A0A8D9EV12_9HEMI